MPINTKDSYKFSDIEVNLISLIAKADRETLEHWEYKLKEAQENVEYWKRHAENSASLSIRASMQVNRK
jgi:hypothetical protein